LDVPRETEHETPTSERHTLGVDTHLVLLPFTDDRVVGVSVGGVPVRILLADPVDDGPPAVLCVLYETVDSRLGDGRVIEPVEVGVPDEEKFLRRDPRNAAVRNTRQRRRRAAGAPPGHR